MPTSSGPYNNRVTNAADHSFMVAMLLTRGPVEWTALGLAVAVAALGLVVLPVAVPGDSGGDNH